MPSLQNASIFSDDNLRSVVFGRLRIQLAECGARPMLRHTENAKENGDQNAVIIIGVEVVTVDVVDVVVVVVVMVIIIGMTIVIVSSTSRNSSRRRSR